MVELQRLRPRPLRSLQWPGAATKDCFCTVTAGWRSDHCRAAAGVARIVAARDAIRRVATTTRDSSVITPKPARGQSHRTFSRSFSLYLRIPYSRKPNWNGSPFRKFRRTIQSPIRRKNCRANRKGFRHHRPMGTSPRRRRRVPSSGRHGSKSLSATDGDQGDRAASKIEASMKRMPV